MIEIGVVALEAIRFGADDDHDDVRKA